MSEALNLDPTILSTLVALHKAKQLSSVNEAFALFGRPYGLAIALSKFSEIEKAAAGDGTLRWLDADPENEIEAGFYAGIAPEAALAAPEATAIEGALGTTLGAMTTES